MDTLGIRELRQNASKYLERVKKGESFEVTDRGVPVAVLLPVPKPTASLYDRLVAEGKLVPAQRNLGEYLRRHPPAEARSNDGRTLTETLVEMREEERY